MPIWKQDHSAPKETAPTPDAMRSRAADSPGDVSAGAAHGNRPAARGPKESVIGEELTIEGKIEGSGHVRIAGRFKGDVNVKGNLAIDSGATLTGDVRANTVTIAGQLDGNIDGAARVELLETGVLNGDLNAESLTVAAGSRMRGKVSFGWELPEGRGADSERTAGTPRLRVESGTAP
jgi:cytoskeletal protein CcmA (bactofilin family)